MPTIPPKQKVPDLYLLCNKGRGCVVDGPAVDRDQNGRIIQPKCCQGGLLASCKHQDNHVFQSILYDPTGKVRRPKRRHTQIDIFGRTSPIHDLDQVKRLHEQFRAEVQSRAQQNTTLPVTIVDTCVQYVDYINGAGPFGHKMKKKGLAGKGTRKAIRSNLIQFWDILKKYGFDPNKVTIHKFCDTNPANFPGMLTPSAAFSKYLTEQGYTNSTYNKKRSHIKGYVDHFIKQWKYKIDSPFVDEIEAADTSGTNTEIITLAEFKKLLSVITEENGDTGRGKNAYRPYLPEAYEFALLTGGRISELAVAEYGWFTATHADWRQGKQENNRVFPINKQLHNFLDRQLQAAREMGIESPKYVIAPYLDKEINPKAASRESIRKSMSLGVTHYWPIVCRELKIEKKITAHSLRATYFTSGRKTYGKDFDLFSGHGPKTVTDARYIRQQDIAEEFMGKELIIR